MCYDYYDVEVPGDCADSIEELASIAIDEARERARLYCIPALWTARLIAGVVGDWTVYFRVCRKRHKHSREFTAIELGLPVNRPERGRTMGRCNGRGRPSVA